MLKKLAASAIAFAIAATSSQAMAQAQSGSEGLARRVDRPTCTKDELKALTDAYVAGQRSGDLSALPLAGTHTISRTWKRWTLHPACGTPRSKLTMR